MNKFKIIFLLFAGISLFITSCTKDEDTEEVRRETLTIALNNEISADSLESVVVWMQNMGTRFALSDIRRDVACKIKERFIRLGYTDTRLDSFTIDKTYRDITYQQLQYNVIARIEGTDYPDSVCIIGAHYDNILKTGDPFTIVPGANDNASGVAAAIEIARVMKKNGYKPRNSIEFIAFGSEELGLFGSGAYAFNSSQNMKQIKFMLNNDMIAYQPIADKSDWVVNILDYDNSHILRGMAEKMCSRFTILNYKNDNTSNKGSDSYPFFMNGYKALFFFSNYFDPYYHSLNDLAENCNFEYCREIVKISCALLVYSN